MLCLALSNQRFCPPYYVRTLVYHSIFRKSLLLPCYHVLNTLLPCLLLLCYHVLHYSVTMSPITLYHVLNILLPCLLLPCTISPITLLPYLLLPCYHVLHYPVSSRNAKPQKKSWQVNYPKEPYPSKQLTCQLVYLFTRLLKISQPFIISSSWTQQA